MNYFFDFFFFTTDEKEASPVKSTEEKRTTLAEGKLNEQQEEAAKERMGSSQRKGWLDWPFWKRNDNSGSTFNVFSKRNKATYAKVKESGKGDGSEDMNEARRSRENCDGGGPSKAVDSITSNESMSGAKSSVSDQEPLVRYNDRPNGGKDVGLNMQKVEELRKKKQKVMQTQHAATSCLGVLEEKHTSNGQVQRRNAQPLIPEKYVDPIPSAPTSSAQKQKTDVTKEAKTDQINRQVPTTAKVEKRTTNPQPAPVTSRTAPRQEPVPKSKPDTKTIAEKNAETKVFEHKKIDRKNVVKNTQEVKMAVNVKKNGECNQAQKSQPKKAAVPRANCVKIDEKPSLPSTLSTTVVKTTVHQTSIQVSQKNVAIKPADKAKTEANYQAAHQKGCVEDTNANIRLNNRFAPSLQGPVSHPRPENKLPMKQLNLDSPVSRRAVANFTFQSPPKQQAPPTGPQTAKIFQASKSSTPANTAPQNIVPQNLGPKPSKQLPQDLRVQTPVQQSSKQASAQGSTVRISNPSAPACMTKPATPNHQAQRQQLPNQQQPKPQTDHNQQVRIPPKPSEVRPLNRPHSNPQQPSPQTAGPQAPCPQGVSPQASSLQTKQRPKPLTAKRRAPGLAKPAGETTTESGETTRQHQKESDNSPKRKILCSRYGRELVIEPNTPVVLPGSSVNPQGTKNIAKASETEKKCPLQSVPKTKAEFPAKQENQQVKPVKPVMKDASTSTFTSSTFVDAAVQVPDEENPGDEIQSLLVKRPWDTERVMKMQVLLDEKLVVIGRIKEMSRKQRDELKSTKKRCSELETLIKASNMQGKPQLIAQVDELNDIKNELVAEVTNLTIELEKERTNVKGLKTELAEVRAQLTASRKKGANPTGQ